MNFLNKYAKRSLESADTTDNQTTDDAVQLDSSDTPVENSGERVEAPDTTDNLDTDTTNPDEPNLGDEGEGDTEPAGDTGDTEPTDGDGEGNGDGQEPDAKPEEDKGDDGDSEEEATDEQKEEAAAELESFREELVNDYIDGGISNENAVIIDGHISRILKRVGMSKVKVVPSIEHFSTERRVIATNVLIDHLDQVIRKLRR